VIYKEKEEYDRAIEDFNKAILLNPNYVTAYFNRGRANELAGNAKKAIRDYKKPWN